MPRTGADRHMKYYRGIPCGYITVLSSWSCDDSYESVTCRATGILLPSVSPEEVRQLSAVQRIQVAIYNAVRRMPVLRLLLYLIGPSFTVVACADGK